MPTYKCRSKEMVSRIVFFDMDLEGTKYGWMVMRLTLLLLQHMLVCGNSDVEWPQVNCWIKPQDTKFICMHLCKIERDHQVSSQRLTSSLERELHSPFKQMLQVCLHFLCTLPSLHIRGHYKPQTVLPSYVIHLLPSARQGTCTMCSCNSSSLLFHKIKFNAMHTCLFSQQQVVQRQRQIGSVS